ncbi:hypothetical protein [Bartonella queenslandensis]|uniref:hypothetical protein n=1 Tax=Bartonella queenslandensis TaxID=481138 RepID=UPI001BA9697F|nr:hypothetical protein [Bartonella queenslandensis]
MKHKGFDMARGWNGCNGVEELEERLVINGLGLFISFLQLSVNKQNRKNAEM